MALQAKKTSDPDLPSWTEAMNGPYADGYREAAKLEIDTLKNMNAWDEVKRESWMNVLPGTWAFRRKTFPSGETKKLKGRFCVRGDREIAGVHFDPDRIFAPVVSWTTVRLLLLLAAQLDLATRQVDYAIGFKQAVDVDPCLFISDKVICLIYVDDTLLYAKDHADIDEVIRQLREERNMALEVEDDVAGFLGVDIRKDKKTGYVTLKQIGLKKKIIEALKIDDLPAMYTPADEILGKDEDGEPPHCDFNYASVIGMTFYLYSHSAPEIGFAISQLARFSFNPKRSHELALIRLGQYLKGTLKEGMVLKPMNLDEFRMDVYVDSDFMGLYGKDRRN
jgi:hypothetical protein